MSSLAVELLWPPCSEFEVCGGRTETVPHRTLALASADAHPNQVSLKTDAKRQFP